MVSVVVVVVDNEADEVRRELRAGTESWRFGASRAANGGQGSLFPADSYLPFVDKLDFILQPREH